MESCFHSIKRKIQIVIISLNLVTFLIIITFTKSKNNDNYNEYTSLSKYLTNTYIILILLILLIDSINHKFICSFIKDNLSCFSNDIGKLIINLLIGVLFWCSNNSSHVIFGLINFISSLTLFLCEFLFSCKVLNYIHFDTENNSDDSNEEKKINNSNSTSNDTEKNETNKKNIKNESTLPLDRNQISGNVFAKIKQENMKDQI